MDATPISFFNVPRFENLGSSNFPSLSNQFGVVNANIVKKKAIAVLIAAIFPVFDLAISMLTVQIKTTPLLFTGKFYFSVVGWQCCYCDICRHIANSVKQKDGGFVYKPNFFGSKKDARF